MIMLNFDEQKYVQIVYNRWLELYKKSVVIYLVLLAVSKNINTSDAIRSFLTKNGIEIKQVSLYRTLRRLESMDLITHVVEGTKGTNTFRKIFFITPEGKAFLQKMKRVIKITATI